jgi:nitrate/TMAO reductase-like tetraheme cytochrome c subunit
VTDEKKPRSKRKKRLIIFLSIVGILFVLLVAAVEITSNSKFCGTCHYMAPFVKSWKESAHGKIECTACHYPPGIKGIMKSKFEGLVMLGRYWTNLYKKARPWAEISDLSCLKSGCHDKRLLEGKVKFKSVVFDHKSHLGDVRRGKQLRCTSCHSQIVQGLHMTVTEATCFLCHFKESPTRPLPATCTACHQKEALVKPAKARYDHTQVFAQGFPCTKCHTTTTAGEGNVPREHCIKCHFQTEYLQKIGDTESMHAIHITDHKIECTLCHLEIQHKIIKAEGAMAGCQACHTGTHDAPSILYTGRGGKGVAQPMPNVMLEKGLSCRACHMNEVKKGTAHLPAATWASNAKACESCHGPGYALVFKEGEAAVAGRLAALKGAYARAQAEVRPARGEKKDRAQVLLDEAGFNIDVVEKGRSVHNVPYSRELLSVAFMRVTQALKLVGSGFQPDASAFRTSLVPAACASCHTGVEDVSAPVFSVVFSHRTHLGQNLTCEACHSSIRKHGELTATKASCATCHHRDAKASCVGCHEIQKTIYQGGTASGTQVPGDAMSQAGVDCKDCHLDQAKAVVRPDGAKCVSCHDETYGATFAKWRKGTRDAASRLTSLVSERKSQNPTTEEKAILEAAEQFLDVLTRDGSSGVHNQAFIQGHLAGLEKKILSFKKGPEQD